MLLNQRHYGEKTWKRSSSCSVMGFSERRRIDEMTNVRSFIILQSGEGLTFSSINNPVTFSCEKQNNEVLQILATKLWANSRPWIERSLMQVALLPRRWLLFFCRATKATLRSFFGFFFLYLSLQLFHLLLERILRRLGTPTSKLANTRSELTLDPRRTQLLLTASRQLFITFHLID